MFIINNISILKKNAHNNSHGTHCYFKDDVLAVGLIHAEILY